MDTLNFANLTTKCKCVRSCGFILVIAHANTKEKMSKREIIAGDKIFFGVIYDNQGNIRCRDGEIISDQVLMNDMDWYVKGVEIYGEN